MNIHAGTSALAIPAHDSSSDYDRWAGSICDLLKQKQAVLLAHYYTHPHIQRLAEESNGLVADSLEMARFGASYPAETLVVAGVRFMGESAKIITPNKRVLMPNLEATCSLDLGCDADEFAAFREGYPDHTVVVYANTSAKVKAQADWVVTSSIALKVVEHLDSLDQKILWAPDRHLGDYIKRQTGADMVLWDGACIVHEEFKARGLRELRRVYPDALVLAHPESPSVVLDLADVVGSTSQILNAVKNASQKRCIVATDEGIFYQLHRAAPDKQLIIAPTAGHGATCKSCARCPWMAMNSLENIYHSLKYETGEIHVEPEVIARAQVALQRMLDFQERA